MMVDMTNNDSIDPLHGYSPDEIIVGADGQTLAQVAADAEDERASDERAAQQYIEADAERVLQGLPPLHPCYLVVATIYGYDDTDAPYDASVSSPLSVEEAIAWVAAGTEARRPPPEFRGPLRMHGAQVWAGGACAPLAGLIVAARTGSAS